MEMVPKVGWWGKKLHQYRKPDATGQKNLQTPALTSVSCYLWEVNRIRGPHVCLSYPRPNQIPEKTPLSLRPVAEEYKEVVHMHTRLCIREHMCASVCACMHVLCVHVCINACMCLHAPVCTHTYECVHMEGRDVGSFRRMKDKCSNIFPFGAPSIPASAPPLPSLHEDVVDELLQHTHRQGVRDLHCSPAPSAPTWLSEFLPVFTSLHFTSLVCPTGRV